jgi:glycosyltransferase involved in cell wall biosynthesis
MMTGFGSLLWTTSLTVVGLLGIAAALSCGYLLLLTAFSRKTPLPSARAAFLGRQLCFDVIVPAHNEALLIERTVHNLLNMDWPLECYRVLVVADNCSDDTAALARSAGAVVIERSHDTLRGKGYALELAFQFSRAAEWADAVVVVDADSEASANLLTACAQRIGAGAHAIQVHYGVRDPRASWRTRLMCIALAAFHRVRSRAREHLNVSCGLRGNGWCVTHELLQRIPYRAFSLAEDVEYGIELGLKGYRVHYADEASVDGEMVSDADSAQTQRQRWEHGRFALIRAKTLELLKAAYKKPSAVCFDLAMDLMVLPLSYIALNVALLLSGGLALWWWRPDSIAAPVLSVLGILCSLILLSYVLRGWQLSGMGSQGLKDLARAPFFIGWKLLSMLRSRQPNAWVRTRRGAQ